MSPIIAVPASGFSFCCISRIIVDLPQPLGPIIATRSPRSIWSDVFLNKVFSSYPCVRFSTRATIWVDRGASGNLNRLSFSTHGFSTGSSKRRESSLAAALARPDWPPPDSLLIISRLRVTSFMNFSYWTICCALPLTF